MSGPLLGDAIRSGFWYIKTFTLCPGVKLLSTLASHFTLTLLRLRTATCFDHAPKVSEHHIPTNLTFILTIFIAYTAKRSSHYPQTPLNDAQIDI